MIEGKHAVEKHQDAIGDVEVVGGVLSDVFEATHDVVGAIADGSSGKWRQAFHRCRAMLLQKLFDDVEYVPRAALNFFAAFDSDLGAAGFETQIRTDA